MISKTLSTLMIMVVATTVMVGLIIGTRIRKKIVISLAPSLRAASKISVGTPLRAAERMTIQKPVHVQTKMTISAILFQGALSSQAYGWCLVAVAMAMSRPDWGLLG